METEQIQLDLKKLNEEFNEKVCDYYDEKDGFITWDNEYNIENELTTIKTIWSDVLRAECREVIKSKSNDKNVDENEVKKFYDDQFKKYGDSWELTDDTFLLYFLEAFEEGTIDSSEKLEKLINFTKNDLKFKDDFYDDYFISCIIDLLKVGEKSTLTKDNLFYVLALNKKNDLSPNTLLKCVKKFRLDHSDFERLLSFAKNYMLPDAKNESKAYKKQVKAFFDLIYYMLLYSKDFLSMSGYVAKNLEIAQKIFAYISRSMPKFKHLFSEIDKYKQGVELSNYLNKEGCIKICLPEKNSDVGDIEVAIDYFKWFNKIVLDKLYNDLVFVNSYRCNSINKLNELYNAFTSDFRNEIKKYGIDITEDIKKELVLNRDSFGKILEKINNDTVISSDDFNELVEFIKSKTKDIDITFNKFCPLIIDYSLNMSDMNKFLKLDKNNSLSISDISYFFYYKVNFNQSYKFKDITKFLSVAKNRFTKSKKSGNDKKRKEDVEAFCDLLAYFIIRIDENEAEYIKFEQNVFDWVAENIPEVEFFTKGIKSNKLKYVLEHRLVKFNDSSNKKLEADFSYLQEEFEFFVANTSQLRKTKYQDLKELSKECDDLIDNFLNSEYLNLTHIQQVSKAGYEKDLKQALRVRESKSISPFIKNIAPNIIKSSDDIKIFLENINKVVDNPIDISNCDSFMNSVIDLIVDGVIDISDMLKVLKRFPPKKDEKSEGEKGTKDKLKLITLLKCCSKIKNGQKWNFDQIKEFLKYGFANTTEKNISDSVDSFFKLLIIFVSNADLKNKMDNSDPEEADNEDNINIKEIDMTYEKFVNKILAYAKKLYFKQKNFSWSEHFEFCDSFDKLEKILSEKNINIPELTQNKLKNEIKLGENITDKNKKIKNKDIKEEDIKKIEEKNKIQIEINSKVNNKNKIGEINQSENSGLGIKYEHEYTDKDILLDLKELNSQFSNEFRNNYWHKEKTIIWNGQYNIKNELDEIKEIWKSVLFAECEKVIKSEANNENVNKDKVEKFYNDHFKKYENDWQINCYGADLDFFFKAFKEETIDTSQKVDQLVDFIKNDLKPQNTIRDHLPILTILKLIKSNSEDDLFKILELNQQKNLSPYVLSECVSKFRLNCNSAEKLLSFGKNYELPDPKDREGIYRDEVDDFFRLLWCTLDNTRALFWVNTVKNLEILQKIFTYINKDMPQFKPFFGKIDNENKYTWRGEFFERLGICCIKIYLSEEKSNDGDIKIEIDYFQWFNQFVSYKLRDDNLDRYKENYDKFVSEFSDEVKKYNIEMTGDIKKQLMFNDELLNKTISQINQMKLTNAKEKINKEGNNTNIEKEIKNKDKDIKKIEGKNEIPIEINSKDKNKNRINEINEIDEKNNKVHITKNNNGNLNAELKLIDPIEKKFDSKIKPTNNINPGEKDEKLKSTDLKSNDQIQITNQNESKNNEIDEKNNETGMTVNSKDILKTKLKPISPITKITSSTDNQNGKASETYQKIDGIPVINNSKRENIQDQCPKTTFTPTTKISYPKLIAKIILYALTVVALAVFIFSIIKTFYFLAILSFILCPVFAFIASKIKYKTIDERPNQISTGDLNYQQEITEPKNNELNHEPETAKDGKDKNNNSFSPIEGQK